MEFQYSVIGLVFDTNILLCHGKTLELLLRDFANYNLSIIIPYIVIQELDGLKVS